jgi:hypothetical protein
MTNYTLWLLLVVGDEEPEIVGPFAAVKTRDRRARKLKKYYGNNSGVFMLDIDDRGRPYSGAYSGGFFERKK